MRLTDLGWNDRCAADFEALHLGADVAPGRVVIEFNYLYRVWTGEGELETTAAGRLKHRAERRSDMPVVGDWVAVRRRGNEAGVIVAVLPRRSAFSRKTAGGVTDEQIVAANVDVAFVVMALDADFNMRRLERYLLLTRESGAVPVVLLTKPDLSDTVDAQRAQAASIAGAVPVHVLNPKMHIGLEQVTAYLPAGRTGALLGSSGVGKSTIINRLVGNEVQRTREVREHDSRGRHATSHRELIVLPNGGLIIDTPGMRELQLWDVGDAVRETFDDIEMLAATCHFTDCRHRDEPRCAVRAAIAEGRVAPGRLESYLKLQDELLVLARQQEERAQLDEKRRSRRPTPKARSPKPEA